MSFYLYPAYQPHNSERVICTGMSETNVNLQCDTCFYTPVLQAYILFLSHYAMCMLHSNDVIFLFNKTRSTNSIEKK